MATTSIESEDLTSVKKKSGFDETMDGGGDIENQDPNKPTKTHVNENEAGGPQTEESEGKSKSEKDKNNEGGLSKTEKKRLRNEQLSLEKEEAKLEEQRYKNEQRENAYKSLMHLLSRSKFYSSFLIKKLNGADVIPETSKTTSKKKTGKDSRKSTKDIEYTPPSKKQKMSQSKKKNDKLKAMLSPEAQKRIDEKINLSQEDIEAELNSMSDSEDPNNTAQIESQLAAGFVKPKYLKAELRDYQKTGLEWLKVLYENGLSGILADEMGLGKTVQAIALICHLIEKKIPGPYLIIAPLSTIPNWLAEFERFAPKIPLVLFYGKPHERKEKAKEIKKKKKLDGFETQPVVLTTFEVPLNEKTQLSIHNWRYIIIDEGHRIKNQKCLLFGVLSKCKSINRLLLTGTPLQNNLAELWSLLNFLMPEVFNDLAVFEAWFDAKDLINAEGTKKFLQQEQEKQVVSSLREILKPFMLRRVKTDVCLDLPPKKEVIVYAPMTEIQRELYTATLARDIAKLHRVKPESLIIDDANGMRPKRRCCQQNKYSSVYRNVFDLSNMSISSSSRDSIAEDSNWERSTSGSTNSSMSTHADPTEPKTIQSSQEIEFLADPNKNRLEKFWGQHTNITEENSHYLINLTFGNRATMYKQIVNHPYLVSCPLDPCGLPLVDEKLITASGKFMVLDAMLTKLYDQGHKVLLFSTMTTLLNLVEDYLDMRPWKYVRLDGSCSIEKRQVDIAAFNSDPNIFLFLLSTRAGGIGLNLMAADTVIIFDSDWNPQADIQAMARCHRIGQDRPVVIYKYCSKGSYDEVIVDRAAAKRKLEKLVISKEFDTIRQDKDTLLGLKKLLESSEHEVVNNEKGVFSEEELEKLLDRSDLLSQMEKTD